MNSNSIDNSVFNRQTQTEWAMQYINQGVKIIDPARIDFRPTDNQIQNIKFGKNVCVDINVVFIGKVTIGDNVYIGASCILQDCEVNDNSKVEAFSYIIEAQIGKEAKIGPYARIRPNTKISDGAHIGNFVEIKNSNIGDDSKASHLSYIGDTDIGKKVNIGAGTITCNYDGVNKFRTTIEDEVFIGSDSQLVAPVTIKKGATIGAGSTITKNAPDDKLTLSRSKQITINNWQKPVKKVKK